MLIAAGGCEQQSAAPADQNEAAPAAADAGPPLVKAAGDAALQWGPCPAPFPSGCELTVLHGDPAKPNADVLLRMPAGYAIPAHSHTSAERMILVSGRLDVKYQGAAGATLEPGSYAYGPAGLPHRATCAPTSACTLFVAFEGPVDVQAFAGSVE
ncbi:MAG: cupin domain-containing protein [Sphingomicrobium sp.]